MDKESKELDLFDVIDQFIVRLKRLIKLILDSVLCFVRFNVKYFFLILFFVILGVVAGFFLKSKKNNLYNVGFSVQINGVSSAYVNDIIYVLSQSLGEEGSDSFADKLSLNNQIANKILSLKAFRVIDLNRNGTRDYVDYQDDFVEDSLNVKMDNFLQIEFKKIGSSNCNLVQQKIVDYLNHDQYLIKESLQKNSSIKQNIQAIDTEIDALTEMRRSQMTGAATSYSMVEKGVVKENTYSEDLLKLKEDRIELINQLDVNTKIVNVYTGVYVKPVLSGIKLIIFLVSIFYFLALFFAIVHRYRKELLQFIKA